ncbi:MAG: hypothetical protein WCG45_04395 [bacterium]
MVPYQTLEKMAHIVAEHEQMKDLLIKLGFIKKGSVPLCWEDGKPVSNLKEKIKWE